jgi:hypothetical protein
LLPSQYNLLYNKNSPAKIKGEIMTSTEIKAIIQKELPGIIAEDPLIRDFILRTVSDYYAGKQETESKFDRILSELQKDREEQARKWDENNRRLDNLIQEQNQKWEEQNRKWDENNRRLDNLIQEQNQKWEEENRKWDENNRRLDNLIQEQNRKWDENTQRLDRMENQINETLQELKKLDKKYNSTIGALGSRWGLYSEASFRNALKGILEDSFGVQVLNINEFDDQGEVFGSPDQVEIDLIIKNGVIIVCEIKSNIDKAGMYIFNRKVAFYQKRHQCQVSRKLVISPMVDPLALPVAKNLGIEIYSYSEDVTI